MTVATVSHNQPEPIRRNDNPTGGRLVAWAEALGSAHQLGTALSGTTFVPAVFRGKPDECSAAILMGDELGLTPMQSLQAIYVVSGKVGLYSRAMAAIVMAAGHEVWTESKTDAEVIVCGRRKGSTHVITERWTTARAQRAGYLSNKKYVSDPQSMLLARATSDVCRQIAPDALSGVTGTVEELELGDEPTVTVTRIQPTAAAPKRVQRKQPDPVVVEEPSLDDEPVAEPVPVVPDVAMVTSQQLKKIAAGMRDQGISERTAALAYVSDAIGREISSRNELTRDEASRLIEHLEQHPEPDEPSLDDDAKQEFPWPEGAR